jgi:hypothetical protein
MIVASRISMKNAPATRRAIPLGNERELSVADTVVKVVPGHPNSRFVC